MAFSHSTTSSTGPRRATYSAPTSHLALRRELTAERLHKLEAWMRERQALYPPKSPMGEALRYGLNTWPSMRAVLDDAKLRLDNNLAENALRVVSLGRKNYLSSATRRAAST